MGTFAQSSGNSGLLWRLALYISAAVIAAALLWSIQDRGSALGQDAPLAGEPAPAGEEIIVPEEPPASKSINVLQLAVAGGIFMIPIAAMSLLALTMAFERLLGLRRQRVLPRRLVAGLNKMSQQPGGFDPKEAYRLCEQYPSAAASVVRVMLLRVGRPLAEVESAVSQASQREADRLYANVRWLNLAASLSTMLGLIGTIQGMIMAFHRLTVMDATADRTTVLADGIYTALVTTFAGLAVAIPALLASHFFEGRILKIFHQIDELVFHLLPHIEPFEGQSRFAGGNNGDKSPPEPPVCEPPVRVGSPSR